MITINALWVVAVLIAILICLLLTKDKVLDKSILLLVAHALFTGIIIDSIIFLLIGIAITHITITF